MTPDNIRQDYVHMLQGVVRTIESLITELEDSAIHNKELRDASIEMAMDSVPLARCLRDAKRQAEISLSVYEK